MCTASLSLGWKLLPTIYQLVWSFLPLFMRLASCLYGVGYRPQILWHGDSPPLSSFLIYLILVHFLAPGGGHIGKNVWAVGSVDPTTRNNSRAFDPICGTCGHGSHMWAPPWAPRTRQRGSHKWAPLWTHRTHKWVPPYVGPTEPIICGAYYSFF